MKFPVGRLNATARTLGCMVLALTLTAPAWTAGPPVPRELRLRGGSLHAANVTVFQSVRGADGRLGLGVKARVGSVAGAASVEHPAPQTGAFQVWAVPGSGRGSFHFKGRFYTDSADGLIGLALVTPKGEWYIAGTVSGKTGLSVDLSRSSEGWKGIDRSTSSFAPAPGSWFWIEVDVSSSKGMREWKVFAWGDEKAGPGSPLVTASEPAEEYGRDFQVGVWTAGTGERRVEQLSLELLLGNTGAGGTGTGRAPSWPLNLSPAAKGGITATTGEVEAKPLTTGKEDVSRYADEREVGRFRRTMESSTPGCNRFRYNYYGTAPEVADSEAFLSLSPIDNDCDGLFDEDPPGWGDEDGDGQEDEDPGCEHTLSWISSDSQLGDWSTGEVQVPFVYLFQFFPFRVWVGFLHIDGSDWLLGIAQIIPEGGGLALRGHEFDAVLYDLAYVALQPLAVDILESGTSFPDGQWFGRETTFTAAVTGAVGSTSTTAQIDGGGYNLGESFAVEGLHDISVQVTDLAGRGADSSKSFGIDLTPPSFSALSPAEGAIVGDSAVVVSGQVSADAQQVTVAGAPATLGDPDGDWRSFTSAPVSLVEGGNTVALQAVDRVGHTTDATLQLELDTTPPTIAITAPATGTITGQATVQVTGTAADAHLAAVAVNGVPATLAGGQWTATVPLTPGSNLIAATATDLLGHASSASITVVLDDQPPVITVYESGVEINPPVLLGRPAVFTAQTQDDTQVTTTATVDGTAYTLGAPYGTEGDHGLVVTATDEAGNTATANVSFTVDLTPPQIQGVIPASGSVLDLITVDIAGQVSADTTAVTAAGVAGTLAAPAGTWRDFTVAGVPLPVEGPNPVSIQAVDQVGNTTTLDLTYDRDTQAPALTVTAPEEGLVTRFAVLSVTGTVSDAHLDTLTVNDAPLTPAGDGSFSGQITLAEGTAQVDVVATDTLGHATTVSRGVTLDTQPPVIEVTAGGAPLPDGLVTNQPVTPVVTVTDATELTTTITLNGQPFTSGSQVDAEGTYLLSVNAQDAAGNQASLDRTFTIDTTPPVLAGITPADGTVTAATPQTITGTADDAVTVTVAGQPAVVTSGAFTATGVSLSEGDNAILIEATDPAGNTASTTLTLILDTTAPSIAIGAPADGTLTAESSTMVTGTADDAHLQSVKVNGATAALAGASFQASVPLTADGSHELTVTALDAAGNTATASVTVERDASPPVLTVDSPGATAILGDGQVSVAGSASDPHLDSVTVDGQPAGADSSGGFSTTLNLTEGPHTITVAASDTLGNATTVERHVTIDLSAPAVSFTNPQAGDVLSSGTVTVTGTASDTEGIDHVTVNGQAAALAADGTFTLENLSLPEGESTVTARAWDPAGNDGAASITVTVDTTPPEVSSLVPSDGATGVPPSASLRVVFTETVDPATLEGHIVLSRDGTPMDVTLAPQGNGATVLVTPGTPLVSGAEYMLAVGTEIADPAGHSLAAPAQSTFTTADTTAPDPPQVTAPSSPACFAALALSGTAEPHATVEASGDVTQTAVEAGDDGAWSLSLTPTVTSGAVSVNLVAVDAAGNRSARTPVTVELDCERPHVLSASWDGDVTIDVQLSEPPDEASVTAGASVLLNGVSGPLSFTTEAQGDHILLTLASAPPVDEQPLTLELTTAITDAAGNGLMAYSTVLVGDSGVTLVSGEVFDDARSLPLAGARAALVVDGTPQTDPLTVTTDARGRYQLPVSSSPVVVELSADGYLSCRRRIVPVPGAATIIFDARLAQAGAPVHLEDAAQLPAGVAQLTVPADAVPSEGVDVALSAVSEQALPALLPLGWTPLAAARVDLPGGSTLEAPAVLAFEVGTPGDATVVRYDPAGLDWIAVADGMTVDVTEAGTWAVVVPDPDPTAPGAAVPGSPLPAADSVSPGTMAAQLMLDPPQILPMEISQATVTVTTEHPVPSGFPVEALLDEVLHLMDGSVLAQPPAATDLVLYKRDSGMEAQFGLGASEAARRLALDQGVRDIHIRELPETVRTESLIGPAGGSVLTGDGLGLDVPAGALDHTVGVELDPYAVDNLPAPLPAGLDAVVAATLDLGGATLTTPATLSFPGDGLADVQYLVLTPVEVQGATLWRLAGLAELAAGRLECRPDILPGLSAPWVDAGGLYLVVTPDADPWALIWGTVLEVSGSSPAQNQCRVDVTGGLVALTGPAAAYAAAAPAGTVNLTATDLTLLNAGGVSLSATAGQQLAGTDIPLQVVAPHVIATGPEAGATRVSATTPVTLDLSEPLLTDSGGVLIPPEAVTVQVFVGTDPAQPWAGQTSLSGDGTRITWQPDTRFPSAAQVVVTLSGAVTDLQGYPLGGNGAPFTFGFSVERFLLPADVDPSKIRVYGPGRDGIPAGNSVIEGEVGAVPGDVYLFAEDLDRQAQVTAAIQANQDGSFELLVPLWDGANGFQVGDSLLLHLLGSDDQDDGLGVIPLSIWFNADGTGALVGNKGGQIRTRDGIVLDVPNGSVPDGTMISAVPVDPADALPADAVPSFVTPRAAVSIRLSTAALSGLALELPSSAAPDDPGRTMLFAAIVNIGGRPYPMMIGEAEWDPDTQSYRSLAVNQQTIARIASIGTVGARGASGVAVAQGSIAHTQEAAAVASTGSCQAFNGILHDMTLEVLEPGVDVSYAAGGMTVANAAVVTDSGFAAVPDEAGSANGFSCPYDFIVPVITGDPYQLKVVDPDTGFTLWEGGFDPPGGGLVELPPDASIGSTVSPLRPIAGDPFDLLAFSATSGDQPLADGVTAELSDGNLTVTIGAGALKDSTRLTLINLKTGAKISRQVSGKTALSIPAQPSQPCLVAVEKTLSAVGAPVTVFFDRKIEGKIHDGDGRISLSVQNGGIPPVDISTAGQELTITPQTAWSFGASYTLTLTPALFQAAGFGQDGVSVDLPFHIFEPHHGTAAYDGLIADGALAGDVLLLAARGEGLKAYDVSNPGSVRLLGSFHSVDGGVAAVTTDGFGAVAVLTGVPPQPITLRLLKLSDLDAPGEAPQQAGLEITDQESASAGFLRAETTATSVPFTITGTIADTTDGITVTYPDDHPESWTQLTIDASILTPGHPVILSDGISRRILWKGVAPASGDLIIPRPSPVAANDHPLLLRIHGDTILYAFAQAGPIVAARVTFAPDTGAMGLEAVATATNGAIKGWIRQHPSDCPVPGDSDRVYFGRLSLAPRVKSGAPNDPARPILLSATPFAGLLGFSQAGTSVSVDPTHLSCLRSADGVRLMDVASARFHWDDGSESTIVAVVGHRRLEVLKMGVGEGATPQYVGGIDTPFQSYRVALAVDPVGRMILVRDNAGHLAVYGLPSMRSAPELSAVLDVPAGTGPLVIDADAGVAYVGSTPVQYRMPMIQLVADTDHDGLLEPVRYLQPLGVPEAPGDAQGERAPYLAWVMVKAAGIPEGVNTLTVKVEGLGPGGAPLSDHGDRLLPTRTEIKLERAPGLELDDPSRHTFVSKRPILLIADERARTEVWDQLGEDVKAKLTASDPSKGLYPVCRNCDRDLDGDGAQDIPWGIAAVHGGVSDHTEGPEPIELASAGRVRVTLESSGSNWLSGMAQDGMLPRTEVSSVAWASSSAVGQTPGGDVRAAAIPEAELSTGTVQLERTDLSLPAPGLDVAVSRAYSSGGISWGELGWGWSLDVGGRLRPLPNGEVELRTATGKRYTFTRDGPGASEAKLTAVGTPLELTGRRGGGFVLRGPDGSYTEYDEQGYPERYRDRLRSDPGHGSEIDYVWSASGKLLMIDQRNGKHTTDSHPRRI
ncbi:MAG: hypothetical protein GXP47_14150, partial [Acidobacteria bacterium]|nr:hypothetical protein [Acidobacteriota bacterium]